MLVTLNHQIQHGLFTLQLLDLAAPAAAPIVTMLKDIPSTLQFMLEHSLMHMECLGSTTESVISVSDATPTGFSVKMLDQLPATGKSGPSLWMLCFSGFIHIITDRVLQTEI